MAKAFAIAEKRRQISGGGKTACAGWGAMDRPRAAASDATAGSCESCTADVGRDTKLAERGGETHSSG